MSKTVAEQLGVDGLVRMHFQGFVFYYILNTTFTTFWIPTKS